MNLSLIYECRNLETEHYNSVLEITKLHSFISGNINKWEQDIYIECLPALHLQCAGFASPAVLFLIIQRCCKGQHRSTFS
jgi:hypothetical protein